VTIIRYASTGTTYSNIHEYLNLNLTVQAHPAYLFDFTLDLAELAIMAEVTQAAQTEQRILSVSVIA
jgi:hypothetical protein